MTLPHIDTSAVQRYLDLLYPDASPDAWLVVSWLVAKDDFRSQWFRIAQTDHAVARMAQLAASYDVYLGVGLREPSCRPQTGTRGTGEEVYTIGGLWMELDHTGGVHTAQNLPTPEALLTFIEALPFRFSLLIDSTGGYHGYLLFKEMWVLDTPEEHQRAALLLRRVQRTIQAQAAAYGWKVDGTADLARVLRPAGTLNHKSGTPQPVTILHEDAVRYNPLDIADAPWLASMEDTSTPATDHRDFPPTQLEPIVTGCAWLRHCRDDAARLPEPEWYSMLGIVGRCAEGEQHAHTWSMPDPRYSQEETARKLHHALGDAGPRTCNTIRYDLGAEHYCGHCPHWGKIKSPVVLGRPAPRHVSPPHTSRNGTTPGAQSAEAVQLTGDAGEAARQAAEILLTALATLADEDAKEDAVLDALPMVAHLDMRSWMRLKRQMKRLVPGLNRHDLERAWQELRRTTAQQATPAAGRSQAQIAAALAKDYSGQFVYDLSRQAWMAYAHGLWKPLETERVTQKIVACMDVVLQGDYTWNTCTGVEHLLRARLAQTVPLETPGWLPFQNGALCLETMTLHPHSPERPFTWQLPHAYDPQATCPMTQDWLHEAVGGAHDQVQVLRAYAKAVVTRRVDLQRYLETLGPGGTGKGTYTRLLMALVGIENTCATELKHLEANRFELSQLRGKVLMVITDAERYSGPVNALKAITGQDFVRMEEKFKAQRTEVAPVMVVVAANEPVQSADYTSGLVRRRLAMAFRHRPAVPRDLLSWHTGGWRGELASEIPGILNWVLALPDAQMEALLQQTTTLVPSLQTTWAQSLVDTNPLAEWTNQALILHASTDAEGHPMAVVNVGRAHKLDQRNGYEHQDRWLYPHYRAWVDDTGGKPLSSRRFTGLLRDLFENQLRLDGVVHTDDMYGSRFHGLRLRTASDAEAPLLITGTPPRMTPMTPPMTADTRVHDGCDTCDGFVQNLSSPLSTPCPSGDASPGVWDPIGEPSIHPSYLSYPSSVRGSDVIAPSDPSLVYPNGSAIPPTPVLPPPCAVCEATAPVSPVTEALAAETLVVGEWVWLLSADGVQQNITPYQIRAIAPGTDGHRYARFAETPTGWPLVQCARADPPATVRPLACAICGGTARWEHAGVLRCVTCWPWEGRRTNAGADRAASATGTPRGDPPSMTDDE